MKEKYSYYNSLEYIYTTISLIIIFCLLSLIELFKNFDIQLFTYKLLNDFSTGLLIGLLFFPFYFLLSFAKKPWVEIAKKGLKNKVDNPEFITIKKTFTL